MPPRLRRARLVGYPAPPAPLARIHERRPGRGMREPNAIDFWRGFALITIFVNHVPGNVFERFTYSKYSLSDAAELFVFLAGWAIALATGGRAGPDSPGRVLLLFASRPLEVY